MKILVLGCKGQLGRCLRDQFKNTDYEVVYTSRQQIDIANLEDTKTQIIAIAPDVLVNATAYTNVDKAEEDQKSADLINHLAVDNIANICCQIDCWLIHVSTDYVFDGKSSEPYKEDYQTNPQGVYGATKLKGEIAIKTSACNHIIIRTAWVFSEYGNNFLKTMLSLGLDREELSIIGDQIGCPTYCQDIATSIVAILPQLNAHTELTGIYHYCGDEPCSWYDFANAIFEKAKIVNFKTPRFIYSIESSQYPTLAVRPLYSVLNCDNIKNTFGVSSSNWRLGIKTVLSKL